MRRKVKFKVVAKVYEYEGLHLFMARCAKNWTLAEFAIRCKKKKGGTFTPQRLCQFEHPGLHRISQENKEMLERALAL